MNHTRNFSANFSSGKPGITCVYTDEGYCYKTWDELLKAVHEFLALRPHEWVFIFIFITIFLVGAVGNFLVCYVVLRNKKMRTVTNVFIFNLSLSDFLVIIFCLPVTVVEDVAETWFLGTIMCKILKFLQRVSVYVSVITLTTISIDRCRAIASPFRARLGVRSAILVTFFIWVLAMGSASPDLLFYRTEPTFRPENVTLLMTMCAMEPEKYEGQHLPLFWMPLLGFFALPFLVMAIAYSLTAKRLWYRDASLQNGQGHHSDTQLNSRRNTAKMLIVVVIFFFICYLPVHVYDILRYFKIQKDLNPHVALSLSTMSHLLVYINSSLNPVIYMFMSGTFRHEFKAVLRVWFCLKKKSPSRSCERLGSRTRDTVTVTGFTGNGVSVRKDAAQPYTMIMDDI